MDEMLKTATDVQNAADLLTKHVKAMQSSRKAAFDKEEIDSAKAKTMLLDEMTLLQDASMMYIEAISYVIQVTAGPQADLERAIKEATAMVAKIKKIQSAIEISAAVIVLAGAIVAKNPAGIIAAIKKLDGVVKAKAPPAPVAVAAPVASPTKATSKTKPKTKPKG